jgi:hypothetical protein
MRDDIDNVIDKYRNILEQKNNVKLIIFYTTNDSHPISLKDILKNDFYVKFIRDCKSSGGSMFYKEPDEPVQKNNEVLPTD